MRQVRSWMRRLWILGVLGPLVGNCLAQTQSFPSSGELRQNGWIVLLVGAKQEAWVPRLKSVLPRLRDLERRIEYPLEFLEFLPEKVQGRRVLGFRPRGSLPIHRRVRLDWGRKRRVPRELRPSFRITPMVSGSPRDPRLRFLGIFEGRASYAGSRLELGTWVRMEAQWTRAPEAPSLWEESAGSQWSSPKVDWTPVVPPERGGAPELRFEPRALFEEEVPSQARLRIRFQAVHPDGSESRVSGWRILTLGN